VKLRAGGVPTPTPLPNPPKPPPGVPLPPNPPNPPPGVAPKAEDGVREPIEEGAGVEAP
jgi:hypothetical protein